MEIERFRENSGTSNQINTKKDLKHLACQHNIQARLYSGDGPDRIYQLLGDDHVERWLSTTCDDTYNVRELWSWLIEFLEKKLRVQQQKLLIQGDEKRSRSHPEEKSQYSSICGSQTRFKMLFL